MRRLCYTYDFYQGATSVRFIIAVDRAVKLTAVVNNRAYVSTYLDRFDVDNGRIYFGKNIFSADYVECDLSVGGLKVEIKAAIVSRVSFLRPLGIFCEIGFSAYTVGAPSVCASIKGYARFGSQLFGCNDVAAVTVQKGKTEESMYTFVTGVKGQRAFYLACGVNSTWGKSWEYATACVLNDKKAKIITQAKATVSEFADGFYIDVRSTMFDLGLRIVRDGEAEHLGVRHTVGAQAILKLSTAHVAETEYFTASVSHRGRVKVGGDFLSEEIKEQQRGSVSALNDCTEIK